MAEKPRGRVYNGQEFIADVEYEVVEFPSGETLKVAQLRLYPPIPVTSDRLTLHMADGRKWNFHTRAYGDNLVTGAPYL